MRQAGIAVPVPANFSAGRRLPPERRSSPEGGGDGRGHVLLAAELPAATGESPDGVDRVARPGEHKPGCLTYGPYIRLREGRYRLHVRYASPAEPGRKVGGWDVCVGTDMVIERGSLVGTGGELVAFAAEFALSREASQLLLEARTYFNGTAELRLHELAIEPAGDEAVQR